MPPLDDHELEETAQALPILKTALENPSLKGLLRSPYFLDIAARMDWSDAGDIPVDEREFRVRC